MSYDRTYRTKKTTTTATRSSNRGQRGYFPPPPPGSHNRQHSVLGYWVPLIAIGSVAVGGLAAWIWSERQHDDDDYYPDDKPSRPGMGGQYPTQQSSQPYAGPPPQQGIPGVIPLQDPRPQQGMPPPVGGQQQTSYQGEASSYYNQASMTTEMRSAQRSDQTILGRMTGAIRRTPSPQQFFDSASKQVSAGLAAAGSALGSIMEVESVDGRAADERREREREEREGFSDHERWSEEAEELRRSDAVAAESGRRIDLSRDENPAAARSRRAIAVVVSADLDSHHDPADGAFHAEHASILSHLPVPSESSLDLFVLIYAPDLASLPPLSYRPGARSVSSALGSSYSDLETPLPPPASELAAEHDAPHAPHAPAFEALYARSLALVPSPAQILPFTTRDGYVSLLRHLAPRIAYVSDELAGREGELVAQLRGWVGHTVLVLGDGGHGGLADTETETEDERDAHPHQHPHEGTRAKWWETAGFVGLGKEVDVVDASRVADDWGKRVGGKE